VGSSLKTNNLLIPQIDAPDNLLVKSLTDDGGIGSIVAKIMDNISSKLPYAVIFSDWAAIVGNNYSSIAMPHRVISGKSSGSTLVLKCKRGFALEIQHESEKILDLVNNFLEKKFFAHLKVIQVDCT
jgi:hypothetical protein